MATCDTSETGIATLREREDWIQEARRVLARSPVNYFRVNAWRYWFDFGLCVLIGYSAGHLFLTSPLFSLPQLVAFPITVFWIYRLGSLVHEVCHLGEHEMRVYKVVWNLAVGVPTLTPSPFFTRHHRDHHSQRIYGTPQDPEYVVHIFRPGHWPSILAYVLCVAIFPLLVFLRFLLVPLTYIHPRVREWTLKHASSLTMNLRYERKLTKADRWAIAAIEVPCFLRAAVIPGLIFIGANHWTRMVLLYAVALGVLFLNQMRQLADHHFESDGANVALSRHILDSCNYTSRDFLTWLFFPFSIRYHGLHHLFPSLPYHNLAAAHACLLLGISADSPYRELDQPGWWAVAKRTLFGKPALATD